MKAFAALYEALDSTMSTNGKIEAMTAYFQSASPADAAWAVFFLSGERLKRLISSRMLAGWFQEAAGIPHWLYQECYAAVGDTAETISLLNETFLPAIQQHLQQLASSSLTTLSETPNLSADMPHGASISQLTLLQTLHAPLATIAAESPSDEARNSDWPLSVWMNDFIKPFDKMDDIARKQIILTWWTQFDRQQIFIVNKLLCGAFRVGVSQRLLVRALAAASGLEDSVLSHRLMGHWEPTAAAYEALISSETTTLDISKPYPFFLASSLEQSSENPPETMQKTLSETLGDIADWQIEWKWDGIRAQLIHRAGEVFIWSRGEDLLSGRFPELEESAHQLPEGTVLDGEILAFDLSADHYKPLSFSRLQQRIGRKKLTPKVLQEAPVIFMAYDLLEKEGLDIRHLPLSQRHQHLDAILQEVSAPFLRSEALSLSSWAEAAQVREEARSRRVEGYILKRLNSTYQTGRKKGDWWKWKINPHTIDAVLIYAQAGTGRRANLFTDYTFAVWQGDTLVPVAKAYSGLSNEEINQLDRWIRANTQEKFGPVRSVKAYHVFELGFEGIAESKRHKSGVALRFPRILRWRYDKPMAEADTLDTLKALIHGSS